MSEKEERLFGSKVRLTQDLPRPQGIITPSAGALGILCGYHVASKLWKVDFGNAIIFVPSSMMEIEKIGWEPMIDEALK